MKAIYIAGPMTGKPYCNFPSFDNAARRLAKAGWFPVSPADLDREAGFTDPDDGIVYPVLSKQFVREAMARDLHALLEVDAIYMLHGWKDSRGAKAEHQIALWRGIEVKYEDEEVEQSAPVTTASTGDPKGAAGATKCPLWLLPPGALIETAWVHKLGNEKYGAWNWRKTGVNASTYISAIMRHLLAWSGGEDLDPESGRSHLGHIAACCNILLDAGACDTLLDDRANTQNQGPRTKNL
jgi:hypothetical protein